MENTSTMGMNRTGAQMSRLGVKRMEDAAEEMGPDLNGDEGDLATLRREYIMESPNVGSVPVPGTISGVVQTTLAKMTGTRPETLIDKLGERLAFERSGTRLYDALIAKCEALDDTHAVDLERLRQFREEEARHFRLLADALTQLGADPTAQTPCADVSGVASMGLMQVLDDPRTTIPQCLNAILIAELADHAGWDLLIELARSTGHTDLVEQFELALREELVHEQTVQRWLQHAVLQEV